MKKIFKLGLLLIVIMISCGCQKSYINEIDYKEYKKLIENKESFILEIMRTDCSACISFKPKLEEVAKEYKIEIKYINTDHLTDEEEEELFNITGISGTPTVIFYTDGIEETVASRINGSVSIDKIISKFKANGIID